MSSLPRFGLDDKVVVVTGAGRGIGRTIALDAHRSGAKLAVGSRTTSEIESLATEIESDGGECFFHALDVTDVTSINSFMRAVIEKTKRIDVLINNAGYNQQRPIVDYDEDLYVRILDSNLKSVFFCAQTVAKHMIVKGIEGSIINVSSQAGVTGAPGRGPYSGAKAGVNNLTRTMAVEWAKYGIRVNAVAPTVTRSPLAEQAMMENPEFAEAIKSRNLLRGDLAEQEEISGPVIFLASDAASMVTGHTLVVDGGWTIA